MAKINPITLQEQAYKFIKSKIVNFEFKPGNYILGVKMLGYKPTFSSPFEISNSNVHIHNEAIFVEENSQQCFSCLNLSFKLFNHV